MVLVVKNPPANAGNGRDVDLIPGSRRSPGGGNGNPLQYSCLENPTDRGAWRATVHGVIRVGHNFVTKPPNHPGIEMSLASLPGKPWMLHRTLKSGFVAPD